MIGTLQQVFEDMEHGVYDFTKDGKCSGCEEPSVYVDDLTGKKFWNMTVIRYVGINQKGRSIWLCKCDCGKEKVVVGSELKRGKVKSCGCLNRSIDGLYRSRLYRIHHLMLCRCYTKSTTHYDSYGGRGITVCNEWRGKNGFMNFYNWSMKNGYANDLSIDRIDVNGNYEPNNCRWATHEEQSNNMRRNKFLEYGGERLTVSQWARKLGINHNTLDKRLRKGWSVEVALTKPIDKKYATKTKNCSCEPESHAT